MNKEKSDKKITRKNKKVKFSLEKRFNQLNLRISGEGAIETAKDIMERLSKQTNWFCKSGNDIPSMTEYYMNEGVVKREAEVLAIFEKMIEFKIPQLPPYWTWSTARNIDMIGYRINNEGYLTGIYISNNGVPVPQYFPPEICNFMYLEEIVFNPINLKEVPQEIVNLSRLRVLIIHSGFKISAPVSLLDLENLEYIEFFEFNSDFYEKLRKKSLNLRNLKKQEKRYKEMLKTHGEYWFRSCDECDWCDDKVCFTRIIPIDTRDEYCEFFVPKFFIE